MNAVRVSSSRGQPPHSAATGAASRRSSNDLAVAGPKLARLQQARDRLVAGGRWSNRDGLIFTHALGGPLHHRVVGDAFRIRVGRCPSIARISFHGMRHTYATMLLTEGVPLEVISKMLGHADINVTLRVYAHLDPKRAAVAAGRIDAALSEAMRRRLATLDDQEGQEAR